MTGQGGSGVVVTAYSSNGTAFGTTLANAGSNDTFIVKYNTSGTVQWVARVASSTTEVGYGVAVDSSGNVYVTGIGGTTLTTAYNANGTAFATTIPLNANGNSYLVKYDTNGTVQWVTYVSASNGRDVAVDSSGFVYLTGITATLSTIFNVGGTTFGTVSASSTDTFVVKYTSAGRAVWSATIVSGSATGPGDIAYNIVTDSLGSVYLAGTFGNLPNAPMTVSNGDGSPDIIALGTFAIVKFDTNGIAQWTQPLNGMTSAYGVSTSSTGDVYIVGATASGTMQIMNGDGTPYTILKAIGGQDAFVAKLSSTATPQWAALLTSPVTDAGYAIALDSSANLYVTGQSGGIMTVYNSSGTAFATTLANSGPNDAMLIKYDSSGSVQWIARVASSLNDIGFSIATDSSGNVFVSGQGGNQTLFFYNANGTSFGSLVSQGGDAFVAKYNSSGAVQWIARVASTIQDFGYGLATDSSGSLYIAGGQASGAGIVAYNSNGTSFSPTLPGAGGGDAFIGKYDTSGNVQWLSRIASTGLDLGYGVATSGSLAYVVGQTGAGVTTTAYNADGTAFGTTLATLGSSDAFLIAYDTTTGFVSWVARMGSTGADIGYGVATDSSGNVYVAGSYGATFTAYSSNGVAFGTTLTYAGSTTDAFLAKYNSSGTVQWVARVSYGNSSDIAYTVCTDSAGNVYLGGQTGVTVVAYNADTTFFGSSATQYVGTGVIPFIVKYNSSGVVQWVSSMTGGGNNIRGIVADSSSNLYVVGSLAVSTFVAGST